MKFAFNKCTILLLLLVSASGSGTAGAVVLPKCAAPPFEGEAAVKAIKDELALPYHKTMMVNESANGRLAYCLSRSGMEESGLSFGVSQLDLRTNAKAWLAFVAILTKAVNDDPSVKFEDSDLTYMNARLAGANAPRAKDLLKKKDTRLDALLDRANAALQTASSKQTIDAIHVEDVKAEVAFIRNVQSTLAGSPVGGDRLLGASLAAKLLVMDYHNLFGSIEGKLKPFMMTGTVATAEGPLKIGGDSLAVSDIARFVLSTKQGRGCKANERAELLRRMGYVFNVAKASGDKTTWTKEDRSFFSQELPSILGERCVSRQVDLGHLRTITEQPLWQ
ncbi:hypothetical protein NKH14_33300 [Mesorhizobium sp. M1380]|uniref:hypothetical protein n=1 Tax=Mesorhizobium sp. M1380 TaxID=2957093 RepID=UPI00333C7459